MGHACVVEQTNRDRNTKRTSLRQPTRTVLVDASNKGGHMETTSKSSGLAIYTCARREELNSTCPPLSLAHIHLHAASASTSRRHEQRNNTPRKGMEMTPWF